MSSLNMYGCFINITEEPELNLFPKSQLGVIKSLVKDNNKARNNQLMITTHSPYTLAIFNLIILASKVHEKGNLEIKTYVEQILPTEYHINTKDFIAYALNIDDTEREYCVTITSENTGMIAKNDLDSVSEIISKDFNKLYRLYGETFK